MNKSTRFFVRTTETEKQRFEKAAGSKGLSAFLRSSARYAIKYRRLIEQAQKIGLKTSAMKVVEM